MVLTVLESTFKGPEGTHITAETIEKTSKMLKTCFFFGYDFILGREDKQSRVALAISIRVSQQHFANPPKCRNPPKFSILFYRFFYPFLGA